MHTIAKIIIFYIYFIWFQQRKRSFYKQLFILYFYNNAVRYIERDVHFVYDDKRVNCSVPHWNFPLRCWLVCVVVCTALWIQSDTYAVLVFCFFAVIFTISIFRFAFIWQRCTASSLMRIVCRIKKWISNFFSCCM